MDDILKLYDLVFSDMVNCRIEDKNYNDEIEYNEEIEQITLTKEEIKKITHDLIYKSEYMWEIINDTIDMLVENTIKRRNEV